MYSINETCLEERVRLVQEWKASGLNQVDFAKIKGMEIGDLRYQIRYVRERVPERLNNFVPEETLFVPVPPELIKDPDRTEKPSAFMKDPVLAIQLNSISICASNQINLSLLKTAIEVVLSC